MRKKCSVESCGEEARIKGFCVKHYKCFHRIGKPIPDRQCIHGTSESRFWAKVDKRDCDDCWTWQGQKNKDGYHQFRDGNKMKLAHRFSYELHFGKIPDGMHVLHKCNNPSCVNPHHLRVGSHLDNMKDRKDAGNYLNGESHHNSKITNAQADQIRTSLLPTKELAAVYAISESQVKNIRRGLQRKST